MLDNSEYNLFNIERELLGKENNVLIKPLLSNIRDKDILSKVFSQYEPQVVFHAAAYKHVAMQEQFPWEAIKTNVNGTANLVKLCLEHNTEKFVLVSTDKAVKPINVMGATKRLAELICQGANSSYSTRFMAVRFGNVLGSSGSVIPIFQEQIKAGGPITITDPDMERYFMSVLEAGQGMGSSNSASLVVKGTLIGGLFKILISFFGVLKGVLEGAVLVGNRIFFFGGDISPALLAVGFIVRLNIAVLIFIGGFLGWLVGIPMLGSGLEFAEDPLHGASTLWSTKIRYIGVGAMVIGGLASILKVRKGLADAIKILIDTQKGDNQNEIPMSQRDLPAGAINIFSLLAVLLVGFVYYNITGSTGITILTTFIMIIMAFFFTAVASYIVGLVGNSNSPVSGMTITAVLFTGGMLYVFGFSGTEGMVATLGVAAIVCCAACTSGDVCNDLKTGQIVGSRPYRQQIMQIIGVGVASLVMAPILQLLHENTPGGIGGRELAAPQAGLFASLANGFFGDGNLPLDMVAIGAILGILILTLDYFLFDKNNPGGFRLHLMPIAVGMYLPFGLSTPILIGGLIAYFLTKRSKLANTDDHVLQNGVLLSSGLIAGESLMGILLALFASAGITSINLGLQPGFVTGLTFLSAVGVIWWLYKKSAIKN